MNEYEKLLTNNRLWAEGVTAEDPGFFERLSTIQHPEFLWIGCSDSRVPAVRITSTQPGEIFVHRNIANMVIHTDINLLSVLDYAVNFLKVKHVVVCGHYGCGGVKASITNNDYKALLNMWLRGLKDVYRHNREELDAIADMDARSDRLAELNVMEQVVRLSETTIIQNAWKEQDGPDLHGWVYGLKDGLLKPVMELKAGSRVDPIFRYDNIK